MMATIYSSRRRRSHLSFVALCGTECHIVKSVTRSHLALCICVCTQGFSLQLPKQLY